MNILRNVPLKTYTTLQAGGAADEFVVAHDADELIEAALYAQGTQKETTVIGWGSNILPADAGVPGLVILNLAQKIEIETGGKVRAETGCGFQELFLKTAQARLRGLEFAVGIPGTLGGALVSNAGAYRSCVSEFLTGLEVVQDEQVSWVDPSWMQFSYRDSVLRRPDKPNAVVIRVSMELPPGDPMTIYGEAREYQRQRISKQPPSPSAGSFFKNVNDPELAQRLPNLPAPLKAAGVVPAGFLIEAADLKGYRIGGAIMGSRHANFILNVRNARASDIRALAQHAKSVVKEKFGVELEEEVLYLGRW